MTIAARGLTTGRSVQSEDDHRPRKKIHWSRNIALCVIALLFIIPLAAFILSPAQCQYSNASVHFACASPLQNHSGGFLGFGSLSWHSLWYSWHELTGFNSDSFLHWMETTAYVSLGGTVIAIFTALPAGYAMARLRFRGRRTLLFITMLAMVMPNTVLIIPLFLEVNFTGMLGTIWPVMIIMGFYPFGVYLGFIHYTTNLPYEVVEAGRVDGLSEVGIFMKLALPLAKSAVAIIVFFSFVADWTNYFLPLVLLPNTSDTTISVGLQTLIGTSNLYSPTSTGLRDGSGHVLQLYLPQLALAAVVAALPILLLFVVSQRYLVRGQTLGAVKG